MQTLSQVFCAFVLILQLLDDQVLLDLLGAYIRSIHHPHHTLIPSVLSTLILKLLHSERADVDLIGVGDEILDPSEFIVSILLILFDFLIFRALLVLE